MPEETPEGGAGTAPAESATFTQEEVDRIVTERLRRERQRAEKAARDEFEARIAELEAAQEAGQAAVGELSQAKTELHEAKRRALIAEGVMARAREGTAGPLPPAYLARIEGEDEAGIEAALAAAEEQWAADLATYGRRPTDIGRPSNPGATGRDARPTRVDPDLAERMRRGDPEAFRQYAQIRHG